MLLGRHQDVGLCLSVFLPCARLFGHDIQALLDRSQVGEDQVESKLLELGHRIRIRSKAAGNLDEDVSLPGKRDALGATAGRRVLDAHLRGGLLGRVDGQGQAVQPLVGDVDHADAVSAAAPGHGGKERGLAGPRRADDRDVYRHLDPGTQAPLADHGI